MVRLLTRFDAACPADAAAFLRRLETIRATIDREPGHVSYHIHRTREDETVLFAIEEWRTQDDVDRHVAAAGEGEEARAALALLVQPPATFTILEQ